MKTNTIEKKKPSAADAIRALAQRYGSITPEIVLKDAQRKSSPLHNHFQWNDTAAARQFRLIQASELIRRIKVEYVCSDNRTVRVRAFHNVADEDADESDSNPRGIYVPLETALSVESYKDQLLEKCKRDMKAFQVKYAALSEVEHVISAMSKVV